VWAGLSSQNAEGEKPMPEIKKFEPEKIHAAQKLLRALPDKDHRKSLNETLRMLSGGIRTAIEKGYSRRAIRNMLAEAGVVISTTSLNNFLNGEQKNTHPEKTKEASGKQEPHGVTTPRSQQMNTKGMDGEQQNVVPENSKEPPEKQEL